MMKQPAENTNATATEVKAAAVRATPVSIDPDEIREEVAKVAYQLWQERQGGAGSAKEDWHLAETIVANRLNAISTA